MFLFRLKLKMCTLKTKEKKTSDMAVICIHQTILFTLSEYHLKILASIPL